jgi:hypothetical protein
MVELHAHLIGLGILAPGRRAHAAVERADVGPAVFFLAECVERLDVALQLEPVTEPAGLHE